MIIALDTETTGVDRFHGARPFFVTICFENGDQKWYEWRVDPLTRRPEVPIEDLYDIKNEVYQAESICGHNLRFDVSMLECLYADYKADFQWDWSKTNDSLIAGHLLASSQPHNLTDMVLQYLNHDIEPLEKALEAAMSQARRYCRGYLKGWAIAKKDRPDMPSAKEKTWRYDYWLPALLAERLGYPEWATVLRDYSNADSATSLALWKALEEQLHERQLWSIYQSRMKLVPIASELERRGATINRRRIEELLQKFKKKLDDTTNRCELLAKWSYDYDLKMPHGSANQSLNSFVFDTLKLPVVNRTKRLGAPSFDSKIALPYYLEHLDKSSEEYTFVLDVAKARKRHTSINFLKNYLHFGLPTGGPGSWLRLHTSANMTGTDTLRWSFKNPNSSNISKLEVACMDCRGEGCPECDHTGVESFNLRYCFGPAAGREWWSFDYENLELRIPAYEAREKALIDLLERPKDPPFYGSIHLLGASIIYPELFDPLSSQKGEFKRLYGATNYQWIKNSMFAVLYGCQQKKFDETCRRSGGYLRIREKLVNLFRLSDYWINFANKHGYVETVPDKEVDSKRGYPVMVTRTDYGKILPTVPLNYHVQSTAMHCTNKGMIRWDKKLQEWQKEGFDAFTTLQVHDELICDMPKGNNYERAQELKRLMELSGSDINIPLTVSCKRHSGPWSVEDKEPSVTPHPSLASVR